MTPGSSSRIEKIICLLLLAFVLAEKIIVLLSFGFQYTDFDQALMWYANGEFARGNFHEPCFYGQSYNTMIEALLAVPLTAAGMPVYKALPLITALLAFAPFAWMFARLYRGQNYFAALALCLLWLSLPAEFSLLSGLPRGFMQGIALAFAGLPVLFKFTRARLALFGFCAFLAWSFNPNALLLLGPAGMYLLLQHYRDKKLYLWPLIGALPALAYYLWTKHFYLVHPSYDLHKPWPLEFRADLFSGAWKKTDHFFAYVSPVFLWGGRLLLPFLAVLAALLFRFRRKKEAAAVAVLLLFCIVPLGFVKVHNGDASIFFANARMFLAVPYALALLIVLRPPSSRNRIFFFAALLAGLALLSWKTIALPEVIGRVADPGLNKVVKGGTVRDLEDRSEELLQDAKKVNAQAIIVTERGTSRYVLTPYGTPALHPGAPLMLYPGYERRTWLLEAHAQRVFSSVIFAGEEDAVWEARMKNDPGIVKLRANVYAVSQNEKPLIELLRSFEITVRPF